jgi:hypothetical protein
LSTCTPDFLGFVMQYLDVSQSSRRRPSHGHGGCLVQIHLALGGNIEMGEGRNRVGCLPVGHRSGTTLGCSRGWISAGRQGQSHGHTPSGGSHAHRTCHPTIITSRLVFSGRFSHSCQCPSPPVLDENDSIILMPASPSTPPCVGGNVQERILRSSRGLHRTGSSHPSSCLTAD